MIILNPKFKCGKIQAGSNGFTLIEILLVVLILVVVSGLSIPNLAKSYSRIQLTQTTSDIVYLMRFAQSRAIIQRKIFRFVFDATTHQYHLEESVAAAESKTADSENSFVPVTTRIGKEKNIPEGIVLEADPPFVEFKPNGRIDKVSWTVCYKKNCQIISTKEQNGSVSVLEDRENRLQP